ncbi:MAG: hypothetical protein AAF551_05185, partial [Bacteroidota bacterium]
MRTNPLFFTILVLFSLSGFGQIMPVKKFDYSLLEGKKLFIPTLSASEKFIAKMEKKGKYDKVAAANQTAD